MVSHPGCACSQSPVPPPRLPDDEIPAYREAALKMMPYIELRDSAFYISITPDSAESLGVPKKYYERMKQDILYTNHVISESNRQGFPIELTNPEFHEASAR